MAYQVNSATVMRAGYGRAFDAGYAGSTFGIAATHNPPVATEQDVESGGFNLVAGPPAFTFPRNPRFSLVDLAAANAGNPNLPTPIPPSGAVLYALPSRVRVPTVDSWNVTLQHELTSHLYFELAYVGNKGTFVFTDRISGGTYYDLSQPSLQNLIMQTVKNGSPVPGLDYTNCKGGNKLGTKGAIFTYGNGQSEQQYCLTKPELRSFYQQVEIPNDPCLPANKCFFDPTLFEVRYFGNNANDNYNSFQAKVRKTFNRGYSLLAHYTWSKGLDYDENYFTSDPAAGYGPATFDVRHRFVMTNIWELPVGRGKAWLGGIGPAADRLIGGWTMSAITIWQSGFPFTPTYRQADCANDTDVGSKCRPDRVGTVHISGNREQYFTTTGGQQLLGDQRYCAKNAKFCGVNAAGQSVPGIRIGPWRRPGPGLVGSVGRDSFTGPGFFQTDIGVAKIILISERTDLRFRVDAFNVFNKVNLGQPNTCVDCLSGSGSINSLAPGAIQRELQFSLRIEF